MWYRTLCGKPGGGARWMTRPLCHADKSCRAVTAAVITAHHGTLKMTGATRPAAP